MSTQSTPQADGRTDTQTTTTYSRPTSHQEMTDSELRTAFERAESFREKCLQTGDSRGVELQNEYLALLELEADTREDFDWETPDE